MTSNPTPPTTCQRCGASLPSGTSFCPRCGTGIPVHRPWSGPTLATPSGAVLEPRPEASEAQLAALRRATLGQYEILVEVGRGGMATVYLAHDLALDRKVAIKVLAPALLAMGEGMVERFKREARTAAALSHPHIIPIYAVNEGNEVLYFVMKHVQGRSLDAIVRDVGQLPLTMTQAILAQVADALGYAHRHGVIHRDIKTANIMLDEEGWAVVTDFGIAKVVQAQGLTMTGVTVGTPTYMSPEQCATTEEVTGASDQYSLGVVAYEMLTGTVPFQDDSIMSIMYAHFNQPPRPVTELRSDCPPNLAAAVMRMLEKDPASRWPSMDDVVAVCGRPSLRRDDPIRQQMSSLARAAGHLVGPKTPSSPIALSRVRTRPTFRRPRRWLWPTVGAALAVGVGVREVAVGSGHGGAGRGRPRFRPSGGARGLEPGGAASRAARRRATRRQHDWIAAHERAARRPARGIGGRDVRRSQPGPDGVREWGVAGCGSARRGGDDAVRHGLSAVGGRRAAGERAPGRGVAAASAPSRTPGPTPSPAAGPAAGTCACRVCRGGPAA